MLEKHCKDDRVNLVEAVKSTYSNCNHATSRKSEQKKEDFSMLHLILPVGDPFRFGSKSELEYFVNQHLHLHWAPANPVKVKPFPRLGLGIDCSDLAQDFSVIH